MNFQCKYFPKYLFILLLVLIFGGCSFLAPPYQQIRYSNDPRMEIMKKEMNKEEAAEVLNMYVKDNTETQTYYDPLYFQQKITEQSIRRNTIVTEELISYEATDVSRDTQ